MAGNVRLEKPMEYFNEYLYYRAVQRANEVQDMNEGPHVKKRQAIQLRDRLSEKLAANGQGIGNANKKVFSEALEQTFNEAGVKLFDEKGDADRFYVENLSNFSSITGISNRLDVKADASKSHFLPVSPYSPRYRMGSAFIENGNSLLFVKAEDMGQVTNAAFEARMADEKNPYPLYKAQPGKDITDGAKNVGVSATEGDRSGYAMLSTLVGDKNAREVKAWVEAGSYKRNPDGTMDGPVYASKKQIEQAYDVFSQLKNEGYSFSFARDERPGQLKAKFDTPDGSPFEVRVLDPLHPEYGAGARYYADGYVGYYSTDQQVDTASGGKVQKAYTPDTQECIDLIKYGLGEPMKRSDNRNVGTASMRQVSTRTKGTFTVYDSYYSGYAMNAVVKSLAGTRYNHVLLRVNTEKRDNDMRFKGKSESDQYLIESIDSARKNFTDEVDVEGLIQAHSEHADDAEYVPAFSDNPEVSAIQERYWDVLSGQASELLKPGSSRDEYDETMNELSEYGLSNTAVADFAKSGMVYSGTPEEKVREHFSDLLDYQVGSFTPDADGKRFNLAGVSDYMTSATGKFQNRMNLIAAVKSSDIEADSLKGDSFYNRTIKDRLIKFDKESAEPMIEKKSPFMQAMFRAVSSSLKENACMVDDRDILIDKNGIVQYSAKRVKGRDGSRSSVFSGTIGQIFEPDENGLVHTKYAGSPNYAFVPSMTAKVLPNKEGENLPYEQRLKVDTYQRQMEMGIRYVIRNDVKKNGAETGDTVSLNSIARRNQGVRFSEGELEAKPERLRQAILAAETGRITFDSSITNGADRYNLYVAKNSVDHDPDDDMHLDAISVMGGENYAILRPKESAGRLDARATGTGPQQGCRYLVGGASINPDGSIEPARDADGNIREHAKNGISEYIDEHYGAFDAVDRYDMTVTALRHCKDVKPANVAQVTFGGWGHGDAVVVSREWAEENGIHDIGDKVSDFHGNKGVISLIVDRNMDPEEAKKQKLDTAVEWFKKNPELDMVMSPYSAVSRFNAGLYREAMADGPKGDLTAPDGTVHKGSIGQLDIIIMEQTADKKTTNYMDEEEAASSSRNFGGQTGWSLGSNGALATLQSGFEKNTRSVTALREMLITTGMDLSETGTLRVGYRPHEGENRPVFEMQPLSYWTDKTTGEPKMDKDGNPKVNYEKMRRDMGLLIERSGGMLEMPFPVKFPAGKAVGADGKAVDMGQSPERDTSERSDVSKAAYGGRTYLVPVLSAYMRSNHEINDDSVTVHDYTNQYMNLYEAGLKWREAKEKGADASVLESFERKGQAEYNKITDDLIATRFSGKKNMFRTKILGAEQPAMTAVVTPDPRLDLEEVSMNPQMAEALHVAEGQKVLTWRDPLLTATGMASVKVKFDENMRCMGVAPFTGEGKDRDHDGDTEGIRAFTSGASRREADTELNIRGRLLNTAVKPDERGYYPLAVDTGEDAAAGLVRKPELKEVRDRLTENVNRMELEGREGGSSPTELNHMRGMLLKELNSYVHAVQDASYGAHVISYENPEECFKSIEQYVEDGCKGSLKKLDTFGRYLGVTYERSDDGKIDYSTFLDQGKCMASEKEMQEPLAARNMQQAYTGPAGGQTIQSMVYAAAAEDTDFSNGLSGRPVKASEIMEAFTSTNKQVTQGVLQVKHSASQADDMENVMQKYLSQAASGFKLERGEDMEGNPAWKRVKDIDGKPMQATPEEYVSQMRDVYENGMGVSVVDEKLKIMADYLTDPKTGLIKTPKERRDAAPPLQRLAYDGAGDNGFATLQKLAHEGRNLYEGSPNLNEAMIPRQIRDNMRIQFEREMGFDTKPMTPLVENRLKLDHAQARAEAFVGLVKERPKQEVKEAVTIENPAPEIPFSEIYEFQYAHGKPDMQEILQKKQELHLNVQESMQVETFADPETGGEIVMGAPAAKKSEPRRMPEDIEDVSTEGKGDVDYGE